MNGLYYSLLNRCTFLFIVAAVLTMVAPFFIRRKQGLQTGICCFVVGWHLAIMDFVYEAMWWDAMMGPQFHAKDAHITLIRAMLALVIPLSSLAVIVASGFRATNILNTTNRLLCSSCFLALVDSLLLVWGIAEVALDMDGWITPAYREMLERHSE